VRDVISGVERTEPAAETLSASPLKTGVVQEEVRGAVAAVDEDELPACVPKSVFSCVVLLIWKV